MTSYVLDASAVLRLADKEPGFRRVRDLMKLASKGEAEILMSAVNWAELIHALKRRSQQRPSFDWQATAAGLIDLPLVIVPAEARHAEAAADLKANFQLPFADSFAAALALTAARTSQKTITLITADFDFKAIPTGVLKIEFLPPK